MKKLIFILISLLFLSACCSDRNKLMTAHKQERRYNLSNFNNYKTYRQDNLKITYKNNHDLISTIRAYKTTVNLFKKYGYDVSNFFVTVDIRFILVIDFDKKGTMMYGYYDDRARRIYMSRYSSDYCESFSIMNMITSSPDLHESVIAHEITHKFIHALFGEVSSIDHEYISYVFQILSFPNYLKYLWDKENKYIKAVKTEEMTEKNYMKEPKIFGIRMYKHHVNRPEYINELFKKLKQTK